MRNGRRMDFGRVWWDVYGYEGGFEILHKFPLVVVLAKQFVIWVENMGQMSNVSCLRPSGTVGFGFKYE